MSAERELSAIEECAADWMVRRDRGLTAAQERELARWLADDARHAAVFDALAATWTLLGEVAPVATQGRGRSWRWLPATLAAAAALAVGFVGWTQWTRQADVARGGAFALKAETEVGSLRKVELPDGSVIQLNTDSAVDVRFEAAERRVRLTRGEAHFTVAKNRTRPFIVSAAGVDVRVVGTVFNVRLRSESVDVLVTEGQVRVGSESAPVTDALTAGQKVSIALGAPVSMPVVAPVAVAAPEIKQVLAWQEHRLDFDATPLVEIVAEINRYNRHKLAIADARLNDQRFGGSFPAGDYETFVRMLEANFGVVAERGSGVTRLRLKR